MKFSKIISIILVFIPMMAHSGSWDGHMVHGDSWDGHDKLLHGIVGSSIGIATTAATGNPYYGCAAGTAVGFAKEVYDYRRPATHDASYKDFVVTAAAACISSHITGLYIGPAQIKYQLPF
jgi:hypothetical protein